MEPYDITKTPGAYGARAPRSLARTCMDCRVPIDDGTAAGSRRRVPASARDRPQTARWRLWCRVACRAAAAHTT